MEFYTKIQILRINGLRFAVRHALRLEGSSVSSALGASNKSGSEMHKAAMELALRHPRGAASMLVDHRARDGRLVARHRP